MPEAAVGRESARGRIFSILQGNTIAVAVVVIVLFMFIPMTKTMIDIAMVLNLAVSFVILLTVVYMRRAADFSSFPRAILLDTLFGLAINIASTRNILLHPAVGPGMSSQSEMVKTFADIVAGDNLVIGFIIFIILIVVQVLVVTKGAERVSEVSARFSLDSMNSKMFDVQNELNSGAITEEEAERRKAQIRREIDFYSTMDGSSKFVSGNVKAGIFITVVNLIGGMITGMVFGRMNFTDALNSYARLTIGDGLMSQLPALLISFSTGLLVTGSNDDYSLTDQIRKNFSVDGTIYIIVGATLSVLGVAFHNLSAMVLVPVGGLLVFAGIRMKTTETRRLKAEKEAEAKAAVSRQTGSSPSEVSPLVTVDPLSLDLGFALIPLVDKEKGAELLERVTKIRKEVALDLGLVVPNIHIRDSMALDPEEYSFKIRGIEVGRSHLKMGYYMCLNTGGVPSGKEIAGEATRDPTFGMEAIWVPESKRLEAEKAGYAVIDSPTIIATHLTETIRRNASSILTRQEVSAMLDKLKESAPKVVEEVTQGPSAFTMGEIEAVLRNLLSEQVSIRNMVQILETLSDNAKYTRDTWQLTELVRTSLGAQICLQYADESKILHVISVDQALAEQILSHASVIPGKKPQVAFEPADARRYISAVSAAIASVRDRNFLPIVMCPDEVRLLVKSSTEREIPGLIVISIGEILAAGSDIKIESIGEINAI